MLCSFREIKLHQEFMHILYIYMLNAVSLVNFFASLDLKHAG